MSRVPNGTTALLRRSDEILDAMNAPAPHRSGAPHASSPDQPRVQRTDKDRTAKSLVKEREP